MLSTITLNKGLSNFVGAIKNRRDCKKQKSDRSFQTHKISSNIKSFQVERGSDFLINGLCNERDA